MESEVTLQFQKSHTGIHTFTNNYCHALNILCTCPVIINQKVHSGKQHTNMHIYGNGTTESTRCQLLSGHVKVSRQINKPASLVKCLQNTINLSHTCHSLKNVVDMSTSWDPHRDV